MTDTANNTPKGILLMLLAIFLFTAMDATAKGLIARYPAPQIVFIRFAGQAIVVASLLAMVRGPRGVLPVLRSQHPWLHLARSVCQLGATSLFFLSLGHIGLAEATALTDINPVLITLGATLFLGERLGPRRLFGVLAALVGALIVIRPGLSVFTPAALLPLGAAVCYTGNALLTRHVGPRESPWTPLLHAALLGTGFAALALPFVWTPFAASDLWRVALIACLGSAAQLCIIRSFSMAEASAVAPFAYVGIIFATFWGITLYGEWPDFWTVIGALVIVVAGLYVWHRETQIARRPVRRPV